jgi:hypothetical protein
MDDMDMINPDNQDLQNLKADHRERALLQVSLAE